MEDETKKPKVTLTPLVLRCIASRDPEVVLKANFVELIPFDDPKKAEALLSSLING